jgi:hypothetical protein
MAFAASITSQVPDLVLPVRPRGKWSRRAVSLLTSCSLVVSILQCIARIKFARHTTKPDKQPPLLGFHGRLWGGGGRGRSSLLFMDQISIKTYNPKCRLFYFTCKGTLRRVFNRFYRLEIHSLILVFLTHLVNCCLFNLLSDGNQNLHKSYHPKKTLREFVCRKAN